MLPTQDIECWQSDLQLWQKVDSSQHAGITLSQEFCFNKPFPVVLSFISSYSLRRNNTPLCPVCKKAVYSQKPIVCLRTSTQRGTWITNLQEERVFLRQRRESATCGWVYQLCKCLQEWNGLNKNSRLQSFRGDKYMRVRTKQRSRAAASSSSSVNKRN